METFLICFLVGIMAQMIDGTLGMAYGVTCSTFLRTFGISSALSSACVHLAEVFTTLVSGISHLSMKNTNLKLVAKLAVPGVIGGTHAAYLCKKVPVRTLARRGGRADYRGQHMEADRGAGVIKRVCQKYRI